MFKITTIKTMLLGLAITVSSQVMGQYTITKQKEVSTNENVNMLNNQGGFMTSAIALTNLSSSRAITPIITNTGIKVIAWDLNSTGTSITRKGTYTSSGTNHYDFLRSKKMTSSRLVTAMMRSDKKVELHVYNLSSWGTPSRGTVYTMPETSCSDVALTSLNGTRLIVAVTYEESGSFRTRLKTYDISSNLVTYKNKYTTTAFKPKFCDVDKLTGSRIALLRYGGSKMGMSTYNVASNGSFSFNTNSYSTTAYNPSNRDRADLQVLHSTKFIVGSTTGSSARKYVMNVNYSSGVPSLANYSGQSVSYVMKIRRISNSMYTVLFPTSSNHQFYYATFGINSNNTTTRTAKYFQSKSHENGDHAYMRNMGGNGYLTLTAAVENNKLKLTTWKIKSSISGPEGDIVPLENKSVVEAGVFPNPTSGTSTLSLEVEEDVEISARLFDALGKEKAVLVNSQLTPGTHQFPVDLTGLANGMYIIHVTAGSKTTVHKLIKK